MSERFPRSPTDRGARPDDPRPPGRGVARLTHFASVLAAGGGGLSRLLERTDDRLAEIAGGHGWRLGGYAAETLAAGGKRLRPILVFLCAGAPDGDDAAAEGRFSPEGQGADDLVRAGVAVELVHMATLVHDDVLDRATLRRGRPSVFSSAGRRAATATGDLLFSRAFAELATTGHVEAVRDLSSASSALARGELMQRSDAWSDAVTPRRYLERCELKTASLFSAACRLGAAFGRTGDRGDASEPLGRFGARIGVAFQIFDDVLDVSGPSERTGKQRGADLLDGTVTLPLILARERDPELRRLGLRSIVSDPAQAEGLCDRIGSTGALREARRQALYYVAQAKAALADVTLGERQRQALELVAEGVVERYA